jgi:hypothetical protein
LDAQFIKIDNHSYSRSSIEQFGYLKGAYRGISAKLLPFRFPCKSATVGFSMIPGFGTLTRRVLPVQWAGEATKLSYAQIILLAQ